MEDQSSFQLSFDHIPSSPPLKLNEKTYPDHPMLQGEVKSMCVTLCERKKRDIIIFITEEIL